LIELTPSLASQLPQGLVLNKQSVSNPFTVGAGLPANGGAADSHSALTPLKHKMSFPDGFFRPTD
jgi:hypothetical protein